MNIKMTNQNKAALYYANELHWSVIPTKIENIEGKFVKKPLVIWGEFQDRIATTEEINDWFTKWPDAGVSVVTGKISNLLVLDVDKGGDISWLDIPKTVEEKSIGGGSHYFFKYPNEVINNSNSVIGNKLDIKGEGGLITVAPTQVNEFFKYEWINKPSETELADVPELLLEKIRTTTKESVDFDSIANGVGEGSRNHTAATFVGSLVCRIDPKLWEIAVWGALKDWNSHNSPPLQNYELRSVYESICTIELRRRKGEVDNTTLKIYEGEDRVILAEDKKNEIAEDAKKKPSFVAHTTISMLDECVDGFRKGQLIVLSGPPKHGKSSFCQTLTKHFTDDKIKCIWFSYELGYEELFDKFPMPNLDFYVPNYMESGNLDWIELRIIESKEKFGAEVVFIDHLDFLKDPKDYKMENISQNMSSYVGGIVRRVKSMARKHNVVIFLMCHIRKNQWTSKDLPASEELRDSGQIAQLADIVMMIMRKRAGRESEEIYDSNKATLGVVENRHNGKTKKIPLVLVGNEFMADTYYDN